VVLKLTLIASQMAKTLIENFWITSECDVIFAKQRPQKLHVALFYLCYMFHIVFIKHKMVYSVAYSCAKRHTSNTNDYIRRVSAVKTRPETTTTLKITKTNG